jgi:hypothetical protein
MSRNDDFLIVSCAPEHGEAAKPLSKIKIPMAMMKNHFVSYPKSGRTWIRYVLAQLQFHEHIAFHHDRFEFNNGDKPAHDFDLAARMHRYASVEKLVYLERDPRDIMVSLYFQVTGRFKDYFGYKGGISEFIRDDYFGAENLKQFRQMWEAICLRLGFLKITYEDCHADMDGTLRKILVYYGLDFDSAHLFAAIANADFNKMRALEQSGTFPESWLKPRQGTNKVRVGKAGNFRNTLGEKDVAYLNRVFALPN